MAMDDIDYFLHGDDMQFVEIDLDSGEAAIGEAGSMMYMEDGIQMDTIFGDGSDQQNGVFGKLLGAGKRLITGESLFTTVYTNKGPGKRKVAFAAPYTGKIIPFDLKKFGGTMICQKDAFVLGRAARAGNRLVAVAAVRSTCLAHLRRGADAQRRGRCRRRTGRLARQFAQRE